MKLLNKIEAAIQRDREESQYQHPNRIYNGIFEPKLTTRLLRKSANLSFDYPTRQIHANRFRQEPSRMQPDYAQAYQRLYDTEIQRQFARNDTLSKSMKVAKRNQPKLAPSFGFGANQFQSPNQTKKSFTESYDSYQDMINSTDRKTKLKSIK